MKKYRLKKDLPFAKAGEIFQMGDGKRSGKNEKSLTSEKVITTVLWVNDIHNFDEWFEEVKEFEEWRPKESEIYKCLCQAGIVVCIDRAITDRVYDLNISIGNCYPADTPDEVIIKEQKLIPQAMHRLKMAAKKAWFEFNGSEGPDWENVMQDKYYIYYGHSSTGGKVHIVDTHSVQVFGCIYFPTEKSAQAYIHDNPEDMKLLFGVER